jgi:hypothetical protein
MLPPSPPPSLSLSPYASVKEKLWRAQGAFLDDFDVMRQTPIVLENLEVHHFHDKVGVNGTNQTSMVSIII